MPSMVLSLMKKNGHISEKIKFFMGEMSAADLSRVSGVEAMTIGRILKGEVNPRIDILEKIAMGLKIPLPVLVCKDQELYNIILLLSSAPSNKLQAVKTLLNPDIE